MSNDTNQLNTIVKMIEQQGKMIEQSNINLLDFKHEVRASFLQQDKRFDQQDKRFEALQKDTDSFKQDVREDLREIKYDLRLDKQKLDAVYNERKQVTVKFTRAWSVMAIVITMAAGFVSATIALAMN